MPNELIAQATAARERALTPFSQFKVNAALRTVEGKIYVGCNVENASLELTICAEQVALLNALSEGERDFTEIAVVTDAEKITPPCKACRQFLWEYCSDITILLHSTQNIDYAYQLSEL